MGDVTEAKQKRDPWTDPDPQPEDFEEFLANSRPEDWEHFPGNPDARVFLIPHNDVDRWYRERDEAHARGELMPEEVEAEEAARELDRQRRARSGVRTSPPGRR